MRGWPPQCLVVCSAFPCSVSTGPCWGRRCSREPLQRAQQKWRLASCLSGTLPAVFCRDSEEESKQGDFQMVFACLLLCFPLEGEAAATLNLGLEEPCT